MLLQSRNPLAVQWYMLIVQGLVFFCIYYVIFRFMIRKFNLLTPGREESAGDETIDGYDESISPADNSDSDIQKEARQYVAAVGGSDNIVSIDACITRLRLGVKDSAIVNDAMTKRLGASGVIRLSKQNVQVIVGTRAELVAKAMTEVIAKGPIAGAAPVAAAEEKKPQSLQKQRAM